MNGTDSNSKILLAMQQVEELSLKKKRELLAAMPDPSDWAATGNGKTLSAILGDQQKTAFLSNLSQIDGIIEKLKKSSVGWITCMDSEYPFRLREIPDYPLVLYYKGNPSVLDTDAIAVVGTRTPTRYGAKVTTSFAREFSRAGLTVVSGFARGVDSLAHKVCVEQETPTIAVFACGLDTCYPAENRGLMEAVLSSGGLIVSEYPLGVKPLQYHFPERNRIISGLSRAVFLSEATAKSGSLITARLAIEQDRELYVVPGNIYSPESEGSNRLLQEMPHALVIEPNDVLDAMHVKAPSAEAEIVELTIAETLVTGALHDSELHFEELLEITGLPAGELNSLLINLELNGVIEQTTGNYYALT